MKEEIEFVVNALKDLVNRFQESMIGYEYKEESNTHFIKVKPIEIYEDKQFKKCCSNILFEYIDQYNGSICFISEKDPIQLDKPTIFINPGKAIGNFNECEIIFENSDLITNHIFESNNYEYNKYSLAA